MSGINPDGSLKKFATPVPTTEIEIAAATGDVETLSKILEGGGSSLLSSESSPSGNTPLIWAADAGHASCVKAILEQTPTDDNSINVKGYLGNTALARATRGGHTECVSLLIARNDIDPNHCNEKLQYPLHFAAFKKKMDCVKVLLDSGKCDTLVKDRKGRTPAEDTSVDEIRDLILKYREEHGIVA